MSEWLAKLGASWGMVFALLAALTLAAGSAPRLMRVLHRKRVHRDELHVEEFRQTIDELVTEFENAATAIESRIATQLDRLANAEREIEDKLRRLTLIHVASQNNQISVSDPPKEAETPKARVSTLTPATHPTLAIPTGPPASSRESRSRRLGRFGKTTTDETQQAQFENMRRMAADGASPAAIAEKLRVPLGDVETYLSLRVFAR